MAEPGAQESRELTPKNNDLGVWITKAAFEGKPSLSELPSEFVIPIIVQNQVRDILKLTGEKPLSPQQVRENLEGKVDKASPYYQQILGYLDEQEQLGKMINTEWGVLVTSDEAGNLGVTLPLQGLPDSAYFDSSKLNAKNRAGLSIHSHVSPRPPSYSDAFGSVYHPRPENPPLMACVDTEDFWILVRTQESEISKTINTNKWFPTEPQEEQIQKLTQFTKYYNLALFRGSMKDLSKAERIGTI